MTFCNLLENSGETQDSSTNLHSNRHEKRLNLKLDKKKLVCTYHISEVEAWGMRRGNVNVSSFSSIKKAHLKEASCSVKTGITAETQ